MENKEAKSIATFIVKTLKSHQFESYMVGGCVRDTLLHKAPKDWDVVTNATPDEISHIFQNFDCKIGYVGAAFGVILLSFGQYHIEVATYRTDGVYTDNRRPNQVTFSTSILDDLSRRDFTINTLVMDENNRVYDYLESGKHDLNNKIIRAVGDPAIRFQEDSLRMLRAIRFATKLNFAIDTCTLTAIQENSHLITNISKERIMTELSQILVSNAAIGLELLRVTGILHHILPDIENMIGVEQDKINHPEGDVYQHTLLLFKHMKNASLELSLAVLFHDIGKRATYQNNNGKITFRGHEEVGAAMTQNILTEMKFKNDVIDHVVSMVRQHMKFLNVKNMKDSTLIKFMRQDRFEEYLELHRLDSLASTNDLSNYEFVCKKQVEFEQKIKTTKLITGKELISLGFTPSPLFKEIINVVEEKQLNGDINTVEEAINYIKNTY